MEGDGRADMGVLARMKKAVGITEATLEASRVMVAGLRGWSEGDGHALYLGEREYVHHRHATTHTVIEFT